MGGRGAAWRRKRVPPSGFDQDVASREAQCNKTTPYPHPRRLNDLQTVLFICKIAGQHPFSISYTPSPTPGGRGRPAARERTAVDPPNVVYAGARTVDGRAAAAGRPRDNNNKEAPHINTQPFSVAEGFEAGGKSFTGSFFVL